MNSIKIDDNFLEILKNLRHERITQDNWGTRNPIYLVQKRCEQIVNGEFSNVEVKRLYIENYVDEYLPTFKDIKEGYLRDTGLPKDLIELIEKQNSIEEMYDAIDDYNYKENTESQIFFVHDIIYFDYRWETIAYFLSLKEAKEYQQYQKHNLGVSRVYADYPGYSNRGLLAKFLDILDNEKINIIEE